MQIARQQLATLGDPVIETAERAGCRSEAAFSRVFKKASLKRSGELSAHCSAELITDCELARFVEVGFWGNG